MIEKLDKNNYPSWKFRVTNFLIGKGLYEFVSGEEKELELSEPTTTDERHGKSGMQNTRR